MDGEMLVTKFNQVFPNDDMMSIMTPLKMGKTKNLIF